jgi:flagellar protein FliO/FliZ
MILLSSSLNSFLQLVGVLVIFLFVLVVTYFTTRWVGGFQKNQMAGKSLQVLDTIRIAGNKYIQVIKAGEVYLVIATAKDNVTLLAQLTEEQFGEAVSRMEAVREEKAFSQESFQELLDKVKQRFPKKQD